jgi:putative flippase GtrA
MSSPSGRGHLADFAKVSATGAINTVVGYGVIFGLMGLGTGPFVSNCLGYAVGWVLAYTLYNRWAFRERRPARGATGRYVVGVMVAFAVNLAILRAALHTGLWPWVSQLVAGIGYMVTMYVVSSFWIFRDDTRQRVETL